MTSAPLLAQDSAASSRHDLHASGIVPPPVHANYRRGAPGIYRDYDPRLKELRSNIESLKVVRGNEIRGSSVEDIAKAEELSVIVMQSSQELSSSVKRLKGDPEASQQQHFGRIDRELKACIKEAHGDYNNYSIAQRERFGREYRIAHPHATDKEIKQALDAGHTQQVFARALQGLTGHGVAHSTRDNVLSRHQQIQKLENDIRILAQLYQDLETQVILQEPIVTEMEAKADEVVLHVTQANRSLDTAKEKAWAARKKKWWCCGMIVVIICVLLAVAVPVSVVFINKVNK